MKKRKVLLVILFFLIFLTCGLIFLKFNYSSIFEKNSVIKVSNYDEKRIEMCAEPGNAQCRFNEVIFYKINFETKKEKLKNKIDEINAETDKYYNKSLNSNMDSDECKENADIYSHSESTSSIISTYNNDELINLFVYRIESNICTGDINKIRPESYIYDFEKDDFISQEEFMKKYNISEEMVQNAIINNNQSLSENTNMDLLIEESYDNDGKLDYILAYDNMGALQAWYYSKKLDNYNVATVKEINTD